MIRLAISGIDETTRAGLAARLRGAELVPELDLPAMESASECDALAILDSITPTSEATENWLNAGKHVLILAESCPSIDVLERLAITAKKASAQLMVANPDYYLPSRQLLREQLDAGKLGEVGLVRIHRWLPISPVERKEPPSLPAALAGDLEMASSLVGRAPNLVYAVSTPQSRADGSTGRYFQAHLGFSSGAMALVDYCDQLRAGCAYETLSVIGASGAAYIDEQQNAQLLYSGGQPQAIRADEGVRPLANLLQVFVDGLAAGRDFSTSVNAWRQALVLLDAVQRSLAAEQAIAMEGS